ncbi:hypothetical protein [Halorientalis salina]|uniref:hypothetical protein n=1 Tax=Halorientalis salina TaxID=2932266 RepID=UPI0010ACFEDC|nr:hypothetical protein [Halorientalis salina]
MPYSVRRIALLALIGLLGVTNSLWLLPNEGEPQYTYERAEISVENGSITYRGDSMWAFGHANDLADVDCQRVDGESRVCGFDRYLRSNGPVAVETDTASDERPAFVELDGRYYERIRTENETVTTYDVERVTPDQLLAEIGRNLTGVSADDAASREFLAHEVVVTGESVTTLDKPEDSGGTVDTGVVYERDGSYYTVVVTERSRLDRPVISPITEGFFEFVGAVALLLVVVLLLARYDYTQRVSGKTR